MCVQQKFAFELLLPLVQNHSSMVAQGGGRDTAQFCFYSHWTVDDTEAAEQVDSRRLHAQHTWCC
jgi:hypothetical protein